MSANKDLIAEEGKEIFDTAQAAGKDFLFEAAVAGGIPDHPTTETVSCRATT